MSPENRVTNLFREANKLSLDYPTDQMWIDLIYDAEFDTLNHPATVAERHGLPFVWRKEIRLDKDLAADEILKEEEILDEMIAESNVE